MTVYFITRHPMTERWVRFASRRGKLPWPVDAVLEHLDPVIVQPGDVVMGTLPLKVIDAVLQRGAQFWALDLDVPPALRGKELSATQLAAFKARLTQYEVKSIDSAAVKPGRAARAQGSGAVTVMLVSGEIMPNYIGYRHDPTAQVYLLFTSNMNDRKRALTKMLEALPADAPQVVARKFEDDSYSAMEQAFAVILGKLADQHERLVLNITGGTKLMAMALTRAGQRLAASGVPTNICYVDTGKKCIVDLASDKVQTMMPVIDVQAAIFATGKQAAGCMSATPVFREWMRRDALAEALLKDQDTAAGMHALAAHMRSVLDGKQTSGKKNLLRIDHESARDGCFTVIGEHQRSLLRGAWGKRLLDAGVLAAAPVDHGNGVHGNGVDIQLASLAEVDYLSGSWLEAWVAAQVEAVRPDDWAAGVQLGSGSGRNNELDVLLASGNRTLAIEVKAGDLSRSSNDGVSKASDTLYKLDSIGHDLARYFANNWLVTARDIDKVDSERANDKRITVLALRKNGDKCDGIKDFRDALRKWVDSGREVPAASPLLPRPLCASTDAERLGKHAQGVWQR
ncbi:MAG: CRISPR-associated protein Csx16 [Xanthomonadaceae bacterium]|nr:CRISPR-associated protein Csx16 [Xanthomonadaceae bacterium]MDP2184410.1 CRISPR-associated protein Csx16 [Xanthomonadales bacterium]MDZ4116809.1 CRISPR-associated protein Csx16 [Xanthomonadaceae bacterium]MDZ4377810.1 CRISPR-associated protein Csx16 [Xanthomonadaceae bacterium]